MSLERLYERWAKELEARAQLEGRPKGWLEAQLEGRLEVWADSLLIVLKGRGLTITASQRKQMLACTDAAQLAAWVRAAATASSVKELIATSVPRRVRASSKVKVSRS